MVATTADSERLRQLEHSIREFESGSIRIERAVASVLYPPDGDPYVQLDLVLTPPAGRDAWDVDDVFQLHEEVRRTASRFGMPLSVSVSLHSADASDDHATEASDRLGHALDEGDGAQER